MLSDKDAQLLEYREQVLQQKEQIIAMSMDSERTKMSALEQVSSQLVNSRLVKLLIQLKQ